MENFKKEDFPEIKFNTPYLLEGIYETKKDFILIEPKVEYEESQANYTYLYISDNGKLYFFANLGKLKKIEAEKDFNAFSGILSKNNKKVFIYREQVFHSIFGMDMGNGIYKQEIKLAANIIYFQNGNRCYVYSVTN
ncbi:hypothetical protein [Chryseobacterium sp. SIMBA_029]|uniref:hypothetical protein n=1 Tax=Chryseobacterium sp. SIMBA_029 TaxID=3085772 RepID=UPI00397A6FAB